MVANIFFLQVIAEMLLITLIVVYTKKYKKYQTESNANNLVVFSTAFLLVTFTLLSLFNNYDWFIIAAILFATFMLLRNKIYYYNINKEIKSILYIIVPLALIKTCVFEIGLVPSSSMKPTLNIGQFLVLNKYEMLFNNEQIESGEIIVFNHGNQNLIKRVIGLPGDTIVYDNNKNLFINNHKVTQVFDRQVTNNENSKSTLINQYKENKYKIWINPKTQWIYPNIINNNDCDVNESFIKCIIPKDKFFVMGDNRDDSFDSRYWGFVDKKDITSTPSFSL